MLEIFLDLFTQSCLIHFNGFTAFIVWMLHNWPNQSLVKGHFLFFFFYNALLSQRMLQCCVCTCNLIPVCVYLFLFKSGIAESIVILMDVTKSSFIRVNFVSS